jgi:hypothetical protein
MPNYSNGKIYKLTNPSTNKVYIGSTTLSLKIRFSNHKSYHKRYINNKCAYMTACDMFNDSPDVSIELLEECPCDNSLDLAKRERHHIDSNRGICVNHNIPSQSLEEWYDNNRQAIRAYNRGYFERNKERLCKSSRQYYQKHLDVNRAKRRAYARHRRSEFGLLCSLYSSLA